MGGTFDPVHYVHLMLAENAYSQFDLDEVVLLPSGDPPHKTKRHITSASLRYDMLKLASEGIPYFTISDMGAFYEYEGGYNKGKEAIVFNIFKASSKSIDSTVLEKDVKQFISSNEKLYKKIGLCLININFSKLKNLFVENIDRFLNDNEYYSDLRCLLSNNIANIKDEKTQEIIVRKIQTASFGLNNKKALEILKNYLCKLLSQSGLNAPFVEPTKADISFVMNYNKSFYVVNHDFESDIVSIKEKIKDVSVYESVDIFNKLIKGSGYFQDTVRRAFIETYFLETGSSKNVALFGYEFGIALIHYHENKKEMTLLYETISDVLNVCKEDSSFVNCMSSILFSIHSNYQKLGKEKFKSLLKMIDYKWLVIDEFKYEEEIISECINENMHTYFELLTFAVDKRVLPFAYLKEVVPFHMKMYSSSKFKAILAFVFPRIFRINKSFALSLIDFVFDNWFMNTNPSYCMLAISHGYSLELIELLSSRNDLKAYLLNQKENRDVKMAQSILFNWFLAGYFKDKKYDEILDLAFNSKRYDVIIENIRSLNYWIEERQIKNNDKELLNYFSKFFLCIDDSLKAYSERDQLIRELSSSIILTNGLIKESWLSLMKLFDYFDHFFSDESVELIKKFKDTHKDYVTQVLNKYFDSYDQLRTYEDTLRQVLGIIASDVFYKEQIKKWQVSISKKNPYFVF